MMEGLIGILKSVSGILCVRTKRFWWWWGGAVWFGAMVRQCEKGKIIVKEKRTSLMLKAL